MIIDSGSELTIMNEARFEAIKEANKGKTFNELPVQNINIVGIAGNKVRSVRKQVFLQMKSNDFIIDVVFLICSNIADVIILGCDFLKKMRAVIDLIRNEVTFENGSKKYKCAIVAEIEALTSRLNKGKINVLGPSEKAVQCARVAEIDAGICRLKGENKSVTEPHEWVVAYNNIDYRDTEEVLYNANGDNSIMGGNMKNTASEIIDEELWQERIKEVRQFSASNEIISPEDKEILVNIYERHKKVFAEQVGCAKGFECKLQIKEGVVFNKKSYPVPHSLKIQVQKQIDEMLENGIIEPSVSQHTSPLVTVLKKNGDIRLCLDAREINKSIIGEKTSPGNMEEMLRNFHGTRFISSYDAVSGYWQVSVHPESRQYISFVFNNRSYQFKRLPFGLINSVAIFTRCIDQILGPEILSFATVYVDDFLITSSTFEQHCERVEKVLQKLEENGITLKAAKSTFITQQTKFLGYILSPDGLQTDSEKLQAIQKFPRPKNLRQMQSFMGMCNYYRAFQAQYSELTAQLNKVMSKKKPWKWGPEEEEAFNEIKKRFLSCVMLKHPDFNKIFYLNCDASNISLGAELYQEDETGEHLVIAFASRVLSACERNYTVTEKEMLSVVFACTKFRTFILGHQIVVRSDHKAISFFRECRLSHGRLTRWILALQSYNITWTYVPGKENKIADTLSRVNCDTGEYEDEQADLFKIYTALRVKEDLEKILRNIQIEQQQDEKIQQQKTRVEAADPIIVEFYTIHEGLLFYRRTLNDSQWKLVVPEKLINKVILDYHERYGHFGGCKTYKALTEHLYIKGACRRVAHVISSCDVCQKVKVANVRREGELHAVLASKKLERIFLDICGAFPPSVRTGKRFIIVILDCYSKYVKLYAIKRATTRTILDKIKNDYLQNVGVPDAIITDHGSQFKGKRWHDELLEIGIKTYKTSVYHPKSNISERILRETGRLLRTYCHQNHRTWANFLDTIEEFMNLAYHDSIDATPYEVMKGTKPPRVIEEIISFPRNPEEADEERAEELKRRVDSRLEMRALQRWEKQKRHKFINTKFGIGDLVLLKNHQRAKTKDFTATKLMVLYYGPFRVTDIKNPNVYGISFVNSERFKGNYNSEQMKIYKQPNHNENG